MIEEIIALEWKMFDQVQNIGGRAFCQDDWTTFYIMRKSQFECFSEKTQQLYLEDLKEADQSGRNLMTEKYAYMMASTDPERYQEIQPFLPEIDEERKQLIDAVVAIEVAMTEDLYQKYPGLSARARYIHTSEDTPEETSSETYLRGELSTYSPDTLISYIQDVIAYVNEGVNLIEKMVEKETKSYGYSTLEEAQEALKTVD